MQIKTLALPAVIALLAVGCAPQQTTKPEAKKEEPPKLMMGASGSMLANTCAGCHGTNGISHGPAAPTIAGLDAEYLLETMQAYKSGERHGTIMNRIAKGYTDEELGQIAEHYSKQAFVGWIQAKVTDEAKLGHKIHDKFCEKCHEDGGTSVEDVPLAGQWQPYVEWTITDYFNGHNKATEKMQKQIDKLVAAHPELSKEQMASALSQYYASRSAEGYKQAK